MTPEWHVPGPTLRAYAAERLPDSEAWSVEAHVIECLPCRRSISEAAEVSEVSSVVQRVRMDLSGELPAQGDSRPATRLRRLAVLLGSGPAARGAWLIAVLFALATAIGLDLAIPEDGQDWWSEHGSALLLIAPVLPLLGVAASYGRIDPAHEIATSTPLGGLRLILWRTLSVLIVTVPAATVVGLVMNKVSLMSWLLPCAGLTCLTLALGSVFRLEIAATGVGVGWLLLAPLPLLAEQVPLLLARPLPVMWSGLIVASVAILYLRRSAFQHTAFPPRRS